MTPRLRELGEETLRRLADAATSGRLCAPWPDDAVAHVVGGPAWLGAELRSLSAAGLSATHVGWMAGLLAAERAEARRRWEGVELVWSGAGAETRDTGAVVRQLFASAQRELIVVTFVLDDDAQARELLAVLQDRMAAVPTLRVRFFVNVKRDLGDERAADDIVAAYAAWFRSRVWPTGRRPEVYYDRRALTPGSGPKTTMHAKCVVQDGERALITSANLTDAAQNRNLEVGVLLHDAERCAQLRATFDPHQPWFAALPGLG